MTPEQVFALIKSHAWIPLLAVGIGLLIRLAKSDVVGPSIPARARPWVAIGLGVAGGVADAILAGTSWPVALLQGVMAAFTAITGHDAVIEGLRGGKELPVPAAMKAAAVIPIALLIGSVGACSFLQSPEAKVIERQALTDVQIACVLEHELMQVPALEATCAIEHDLAPVIEALLSAHRAAVRRELQARAEAVFGKALANCDGGDAR